jgi:hypothetical protein
MTEDLHSNRFQVTTCHLDQFLILVIPFQVGCHLDQFLILVIPFQVGLETLDRWYDLT